MIRNSALVLAMWTLLQLNPWSSGMHHTQHVRVGTGSILTGVRADITCTWPTAFSDTNYAFAVSIEDTSALGLGLQSERVRSKTTSAVTVQVFNAAIGTNSGTVHCIGFHD